MQAGRCRLLGVLHASRSAALGAWDVRSANSRANEEDLLGSSRGKNIGSGARKRRPTTFFPR